MNAHGHTMNDTLSRPASCHVAGRAQVAMVRGQMEELEAKVRNICNFGNKHR